ncbi:uncharacterized protein PADG_11961 [Paracoccidioides brasiliensis Pb18]|uniref:Uncharacterized protein n=1 Tax=Paracoccidioides brasiliensis (strain Pb18) TaxID=502780 RepID=A0A0A0HVA9_PARBD|nr:uncharacterized protein PADG_11961 [Paracoccidioides brasiliensis Pb18]KGM91981.1 hypothetical protein PADG_11961 [Paracoccidioides brasiliensis Pb18]
MGSVVFGRKRPNGRRIKGKVKKATKYAVSRRLKLLDLTLGISKQQKQQQQQQQRRRRRRRLRRRRPQQQQHTLSLIISQSGSLKGMWGLEKDSGMIDQALGVVFPHLSAPPG